MQVLQRHVNATLYFKKIHISQDLFSKSNQVFEIDIFFAGPAEGLERHPPLLLLLHRQQEEVPPPASLHAPLQEGRAVPHQPEDEEELPEVQVRAVPRSRDEARVGPDRGGEGEEVQVRPVKIPNQGFLRYQSNKNLPAKAEKKEKKREKVD